MKKRNLFASNLPPCEPSPELQRAVKIALHRFAKHWTPACPDRHEWWCDCQQEAWLAVLRSAPRYRCPDPPPADPESHFVMWLAGKALKRLRKYRAQEAKYYGAVVPMVIEREGEEGMEMEFEDEGAQAQVEVVLETVLLEQVLERLVPHMDAKDWVILEWIRAGKGQKEIAAEFRISQQAVGKRLRQICKLARAILGEVG